MNHFSFSEVSISEIEKEWRELNSNKATMFVNIATNVFNHSRRSYSYTLQKLFPDKLKCADITPVFKKMIQQKQRIIDQ